MRITPRSIVLASAILAAAAFTTHTAAAETVKVPFDFKINGKTLPAGQYYVNPTHQLNFVSLEAATTGKSYTWVLEPGDPSPTSSDVTVSFTKDDAGYQLHSIQFHARTTPRIDKNVSEKASVRVLRGE